MSERIELHHDLETGRLAIVGDKLLIDSIITAALVGVTEIVAGRAGGNHPAPPDVVALNEALLPTVARLSSQMHEIDGDDAGSYQLASMAAAADRINRTKRGQP